ncbi:site-specific integrase [Microvirga sp. BT291]|nr:site-specific integrase [Microvirga pudoricolor]
MLSTDDPSLFDFKAAVSLRGSKASTEFWISLSTADYGKAKEMVRSLDAEADRIFSRARQRLALHKAPLTIAIDDRALERLATDFKYRKLAADEAKRRGTSPMSRGEWQILAAQLREEEAALRDANARGDNLYVHFDNDAIQALADAGVQLDDHFSSLANRIYRSLTEAWLEALEIVRARHEGASVRTPERPLPPSAFPQHQKVQVTVASLIEGWKLEKQPTEKTSYTFQRRLMKFEEFLKSRGLSVATATLDDAADWKAELLQSGKSMKTVADFIAASKAVYGWAMENRRVAANPFALVKTPAQKKGRSDKRRGFSDDETKALLLDARGRDGYRRWIPWLAAFTGARLDELCQLRASDVRQADECHYIDINDDHPDKHLKNQGSRRRVPLHPVLLQEGFLQFVASCGSKDAHLFGEITPDRFGRRGGNATKVLSRWVRRDLEITDPRIAPNHSLRHRFKDICRNSGISKEVSDALTGHSSSDVGSSYGEGFSISFLAKEICKISAENGVPPATLRSKGH